MIFFPISAIHTGKFAPAAMLLAGALLFIGAPRAQPVQSNDDFIRSLAAYIDQSKLAPRERLGLRIFFDPNL